MKVVYLFSVILAFALFSCQKKTSDLTSRYPFVQGLDKSLEVYDYIKVINDAADTLRLNQNLEPDFKKEIYLRYAIAISMRNYGSIHFSILDSLQAYQVDSLYQKINSDLIQKSNQVYTKARDHYQSRDFESALKLAQDAYLIYPGLDEAHALEDSINLIINQSKPY